MSIGVTKRGVQSPPIKLKKINKLVIFIYYNLYIKKKTNQSITIKIYEFTILDHTLYGKVVKRDVR